MPNAPESLMDDWSEIETVFENGRDYGEYFDDQDDPANHPGDCCCFLCIPGY